MYLNEENSIQDALGKTEFYPGSFGNFDRDSNVFIIQGNPSENLEVYNPKNM